MLTKRVWLKQAGSKRTLQGASRRTAQDQFLMEGLISVQCGGRLINVREGQSLRIEIVDHVLQGPPFL